MFCAAWHEKCIRHKRPDPHEFEAVGVVATCTAQHIFTFDNNNYALSLPCPSANNCKQTGSPGNHARRRALLVQHRAAD